ncbi:MAG: CheB methylesterase domain-containing protein [Nitrosomonadales bacterium]
MATGFIKAFVEWLAQSAGLPVQVAAHGEQMAPGHAYVAPDGFQMKVTHGGRIALTRDAPENGLCPSVSYLFRSLAEIYGGGVLAGLLSGMGRDGAEELKLLKEKGRSLLPRTKIARSCMACRGEAIKLDAVTYILTPDKIATGADGFCAQ